MQTAQNRNINIQYDLLVAKIEQAGINYLENRKAINTAISDPACNPEDIETGLNLLLVHDIFNQDNFDAVIYYPGKARMIAKILRQANIRSILTPAFRHAVCQSIGVNQEKLDVDNEREMVEFLYKIKEASELNQDTDTIVQTISNADIYTQENHTAILTAISDPDCDSKELKNGIILLHVHDFLDQVNFSAIIRFPAKGSFIASILKEVSLANILTPANVDAVTQSIGIDHAAIDKEIMQEMAHTLEVLRRSQRLTQENFSLMMQYPEHGHLIIEGIRKLTIDQINTPENRAYLMQNPEDATSISEAISFLHKKVMATAENYATIIDCPSQALNIAVAIFHLQSAGLLNQKNRTLLLSDCKKYEHKNLIKIPLTLKELFDNNLLTQENFTGLFQLQHVFFLTKIIPILSLAGILTQENISVVIQHSEKAQAIVDVLNLINSKEALSQENCLAIITFSEYVSTRNIDDVICFYNNVYCKPLVQQKIIFKVSLIKTSLAIDSVIRDYGIFSLIARYKDLTGGNGKEYSPLECYCLNGYYKLAKKILDKLPRYPGEYHEFFQEILNLYFADVSDENKPAYRAAADNRNKIIRLMLQRGVTPEPEILFSLPIMMQPCRKAIDYTPKALEMLLLLLQHTDHLPASMEEKSESLDEVQSLYFRLKENGSKSLSQEEKLDLVDGFIEKISEQQDSSRYRYAHFKFAGSIAIPKPDIQFPTVRLGSSQ